MCFKINQIKNLFCVGEKCPSSLLSELNAITVDELSHLSHT